MATSIPQRTTDTGTSSFKTTKISTITSETLQPSGEVIDATGCLVIPGLIDGLVHGGGGYDSMTGQVEDIEAIARAHACSGVTSLVLGISSGSMAQINSALTAIAHVVDEPIADGSQILGSYVEGKFGESRQKWCTERQVHHTTELRRIPRNVGSFRWHLKGYLCCTRKR